VVGIEDVEEVGDVVVADGGATALAPRRQPSRIDLRWLGLAMSETIGATRGGLVGERRHISGEASPTKSYDGCGQQAVAVTSPGDENKREEHIREREERLSKRDGRRGLPGGPQNNIKT
jgi:hypothetical protein